MYEVGLNEPVLFFFCAKRNNKKHGRACTVVWVQTCLSYSHHLFILLAVKTILQFGWRKRRFNDKLPYRRIPFEDEIVFYFRKERQRDRSSCYFCVLFTARLSDLSGLIALLDIEHNYTCLHSHLQTQSGLVNSIPAFH